MSNVSESKVFLGDGPEAVFRQGLKEDVFYLQRCAACGNHVFYPRILCSHCGSMQLEKVVASGQGTVYSVSTVRRRPESGGNYTIVLVDLAEGPRMMSTVTGMAPEEVRIGMKVQAKIDEIDGEPAIIFEQA